MPTFYVIGGMKDPVFLDAVDSTSNIARFTYTESLLSQYEAGHNFFKPICGTTKANYFGKI